MSVYHDVVLEHLGTTAELILKAEKECRIFALQGDLGAGKTALVKEFVRALGGGEASSPTFSIVQPYESKVGEIYHFDLYRMRSADEIIEIGLDEYLYSGAFCFIEWPELITELLPKNSSKLIIIEIQNNGARRIEVKDL